MKTKKALKLQNVEVSGRSGDRVGLGCELEGVRYHIWLQPDTMDAGEILYKNPVKDLRRGDPGYFRTRRLRVDSQSASRLIYAMVDVYKEKALLARFLDREAKEEEERKKRNEEDWRLERTKEAGPELLKMLKKVLPFIEKPDHTGDIVNKRNGDFDSAPLRKNGCACELHRLHVEVRAFLAGLEK